MKRYKNCFLKCLLTGLLTLAFIVYGSVAFADHNVSSYTSDLPEGGAAQQWTEDFDILWNSPDMGGDILVSFAYKWNSSKTPLTYEEFVESNYDGIVRQDETLYYVTLSSEEIEYDDYDDFRYLHIQTVYLQGGLPPFTLSDDKVIGQFNIDNVVSGTIGLNFTETRQTQITITVGHPADIAENGLYLNETSELATAEAFPVTTTTYPLQNTEPGNKIIYAWFKDQAGNVSSPVPTASFELLGAVSIDPNTATIYLAATDTKTFTISGTTDEYTWTVINELPEEANVADFTGTTENVNSVTLQGLNSGTCQLQAVRGGETLVSGTITVVENTTMVNISLLTGWNLISIPVQPEDTAIASVLAGISGKYNIVWGEFNPTTTAWKNYKPTKPVNTLTTMGPGKGYWVETTENTTLTY